MQPTPSGDRRLHLSLPAARESVPQIRRTVASLAEELGYGSRVEDIRLAVTEACANVVVHAYVDAQAPGELEVRAEGDGERFHVEVVDHGRGVLPWDESRGLGMGTPLMSSLSDGMEVRTAAGNGTRISLCFRRTRSRLEQLGSSAPG